MASTHRNIKEGNSNHNINNLNILNGSFGLNYFQSENKVALLFKLIHYEANTDGSIMKMHDIQDAFFELNNYLSNDLIQIKNSFLFVH